MNKALHDYILDELILKLQEKILLNFLVHLAKYLKFQ